MFPKNKIVALGLILFSCAACHSDDYAELHGTYVGHNECLETFMPFFATFYSVLTQTASFQLNLARSRKVKETNDIVVIAFEDGPVPQIGTTYRAGKPLNPDAKIVVRILPNGSCEPHTESLYYDGVVLFDDFSNISGSYIRGEFQSGKVINERTGMVEIENFSGEFSVKVTEGPPHRLFH